MSAMKDHGKARPILGPRARCAGLILDNRRALFEIVLIELLINVTRTIRNRGNSGNTGNTPSQT